MHPPARSSAGFSRLEILAILGGAGILASLALPLRAGGAASSRAGLCQDNYRRLAVALELYTLQNGWYPPNPDDGTIVPGRNWVGGQSGPGGSSEFDPDPVASPSTSLLAPYLGEVGQVFVCPADERWGIYQGARTELRGRLVPTGRSVAMSGAVGTYPFVPGPRPVDGPWLDNQHGHSYGKQWRTYGRPEHAVAPTPSRLAVLVDEDAYSINDGCFSTGMAALEWIDWPATRHDGGATLSFADGHVETHRWLDHRTTVIGGNVRRLLVPGSVDMAWLQERTSAPIAR